MKKSELRQIIREEYRRVIQENYSPHVIAGKIDDLAAEIDSLLDDFKNALVKSTRGDQYGQTVLEKSDRKKLEDAHKKMNRALSDLGAGVTDALKVTRGKG